MLREEECMHILLRDDIISRKFLLRQQFKYEYLNAFSEFHHVTLLPQWHSIDTSLLSL